MNSAELKQFCTSIGVALAGIAPMERFDGLPASEHPRGIFPEARSVIVIGQEIPRGHFRGVEEGMLWTQPNKRILSKYTYEVARFVEADGWEAVPVVPHSATRWPGGRPVAPGRPAPNVLPSLEFAAVAAGLGEIGFCRIFLTPQLGPRQSLGMLLTDAELEPDPVYGGALCGRRDCLECLAGCPLGAISADRTESVEILGTRKDYAVINYAACRVCPNGAFPDKSFLAGTEENIVAISHNQPRTKADAGARGGIPNRLAAACNRACIAHLEAAGLLTRRYNQPFRKRAPWKLGLYDTVD
jgi:epoxyqueuosine reductase